MYIIVTDIPYSSDHDMNFAIRKSERKRIHMWLHNPVDKSPLERWKCIRKHQRNISVQSLPQNSLLITVVKRRNTGVWCEYFVCLFCGLTSRSPTMVMSRRSINLTTPFLSRRRYLLISKILNYR